MLAPLDREQHQAIASDFKTEGVESIAICFLHSYANPLHEEQAREALRTAPDDREVFEKGLQLPPCMLHRRGELNEDVLRGMEGVAAAIELNGQRIGWGRPYLLHPGDSIRYQTPGGGGYGSPRERDPKPAAEELDDGMISEETARTVCGAAGG